MWGCNLGLNCNIISYSDDKIIHSDDIISPFGELSRSDVIISRSDELMSFRRHS